MISTQNFAHFEKKDQLHSLNIWEVIESEKCGYLNARTAPVLNTLPESTRSRVRNTAEICTVALLSKFPISQRQIEIGNMSANQI